MCSFPTLTNALCASAQALLLLLGISSAMAQSWPENLDAALALAAQAQGEQSPEGAWLEVATVRDPWLTLAAPLPGGDGRAPTELAGVTARLWMSSGRTDIGFGLGSVGYLARSPMTAPANSGALIGALPIMTVGLRYRLSDRHTLLADSASVRGMSADLVAPFGTKSVGVEWTPAKPTLGFEKGALGLQMDSGYRLSLKARKGRLTVMMMKRF